MQPTPSAALTFIFINGKGASGKDTQAELMLTEMPNAVRVSTGDYIRAVLKNPDDRFRAIIEPYKSLVDRGINIPDIAIVNPENPGNSIIPVVVQEKVNEGARTIIFAGFPRTPKQLEALQKWLPSLSQTYEVREDYLWLDVPDQISRDRAAKRRREDIEAGREPRGDDDPEVVEQRLQTFKNDTIPMLEQLSDIGKLEMVLATGKPDEVNHLVKMCLGIYEPTLPQRARL